MFELLLKNCAKFELLFNVQLHVYLKN